MIRHMGPMKYPLAFGVTGAFGLLVGTFLATLFAMLAMGDNLLGFDLMQPWFLLYDHARLSFRPDVQQTVWLLTAGCAFMGAMLGITAVKDGPLTQYDDSHFQSPSELRRNKMVAELKDAGLIYGKTTGPKRDGKYISAPQDRFPHCMVVGPTGSGKNVSFVYPNLAQWAGSAIVLDVKGANFKETSALRQGFHKNAIFYFAPYDYVEDDSVEGGTAIRSHRFNPLARIAKLPTPEQQYSAINRMADQFLEVKSHSAQSFFQAGRSIFVSCCLYAIETGKPTLGEVLRIMSGQGGSKKKAFATIAAATTNRKVADNLSAAVDTEDKILDSYVSVIRGAGLGLWDDPALDRATSSHDFDFGSFRRKKQTLYIVTPSDELKTMAPLIRLLFADAIASLQASVPGKDEPHRVLMALDEFDQLAINRMS